MEDAIRWLTLAHMAYAAGLLPWVLLLAIALRRRGYSIPSRGPSNVAGTKPTARVPAMLPQPPLMDLALEPVDPEPPAWVSDGPRGPFGVYPDPHAGLDPGARDAAESSETPADAAPHDRNLDGSASPQPEVVKDRRLALAEARDLVRSALQRLAGSGYYAFEDLLVSGVGAIDQLALGPAGLRVIVVAPERGHVWREAGGEITYSTDAVVDLEAGKIEGTFANPEEDFDATSHALVDDVLSKIGGVETTVWPVIVFPHADVYSGPGGGRAIVSVWNLADALDAPEDRHLSSEAVQELVSRLTRAYGRQPWMRPTSDHEPCADA